MTGNNAYPQFDTGRLRLLPLAERVNDLDLSVVRDLSPSAEVHPGLEETARWIRKAKASGATTTLMMGAHVLRSGVQRYIIDLMERGFLSCLSLNGAGIVHDYEMARIGATTESVSRYIRDGRFGLWKETGEINRIVAEGDRMGQGLGEAIGAYIAQNGLAHADVSVTAAAWKRRVPVTVHVGIGYDIIHEHPDFDPAACGRTSYRDFLRLAAVLERLEGGVVMNFGSAVMAPEVFLKALAMVRNAASAENRRIADFTTLVCDVRPVPETLHTEPDKSDPAYYFRPLKTMLIRTVADGGRGYYVRQPHAVSIPGLWTALVRP